MTGVGAREAQRAAIAAGLIAGHRAVVVVGPEDGEGARAVPSAQCVAADALLAGAGADATALVVLDPMPAKLVLRVARVLAARATDGAAAVLAVPPGQEALVAEVLASARVLRQGAVEAVWVGSEAPKSIEVPAADAESATIRVLLVLGGPEDLDDARLAGRGVREQHAAALEAEAEELRSANARLLSSHRPVESSAAAAMVGKVGLLTQRIAEQEAELVELQRRLEAEVEVGRRNDELFQDARRVIGVREQEIAGLRATLARPRHRIAASAGSRIDRAPRPRGLLARVASKRP